MMEALKGSIALDPHKNGLPSGDPYIIETFKVNSFGGYKAGDYCGTLRACGADMGVGGECLIVTDYRTENSSQLLIRKLSAEELERLQGYDDGWTDIGPWISRSGKNSPSLLSPPEGKPSEIALLFPSGNSSFPVFLTGVSIKRWEAFLTESGAVRLSGADSEARLYGRQKSNHFRPLSPKKDSVTQQRRLIDQHNIRFKQKGLIL